MGRRLREELEEDFEEITFRPHTRNYNDRRSHRSTEYEYPRSRSRNRPRRDRKEFDSY